MTRINPHTSRTEWEKGDKEEEERPILSWLREKGIVGRDNLVVEDLDLVNWVVTTGSRRKLPRPVFENLYPLTL